MAERYFKLTDNYSRPLNTKELIFQVNYLIRKESYKSAYEIIKNNEVNIEELLSYGLKKKDYNKFIKYIEI